MAGIVVNRCDFTIGQYIGRHYHVDLVLGEGAFGKVFKVTEPAGNTYALKLLKLWEIVPELRKPLMDRFTMEFETGLINSRYLVHSEAHGLECGNPFIVMEYCPKGNLSQYMEQNPVDLIKIGSEILYGLRDLHKNGKVHRDLKPENVLIKGDGTAVLTDFGISGDRNRRMTERNILGRPQQIFGTYAYMPPEQVNRIRGEATVLPTTDIFSFGVMMYQLLTGKLPFGELNDHNDLVVYQRNGKAGDWNRNLLEQSGKNAVWKEIIEGCLAPDFKQRLQSVSAVLKLMPQQGAVSEVAYSAATKDVRLIKSGLSLRVMQGNAYGTVYDLNKLFKNRKRLITIGRDESNLICISEKDSPYISRKHCTIETDSKMSRWFIRDGQWQAENLHAGGWRASVNGTYINSTPVMPEGRELRPGDIITIGDVTFRVEAY